MKLKALLFDIDGTVYSNSLMHLHTIPVAMSYFRFMSKFSKARKKLHYCSDDIDRSGLTFNQYQANLLGELLKVDCAEAQKRLDQFRSRWEKIFDRIPPYDGIKEMVLHFRQQGLKTALLSDFPIGNKVKRLKLDGLWDVELCTEDFGAIKPDPRAFLATADALGVKPEECLFIGNSHAFDVEGAKAAGMMVAHIKKGKAKKDSKADFTFYHYHDLQTWIDRLLAEG